MNKMDCSHKASVVVPWSSPSCVSLLFSCWLIFRPYLCIQDILFLVKDYFQEDILSFQAEDYFQEDIHSFQAEDYFQEDIQFFQAEDYFQEDIHPFQAEDFFQDIQEDHDVDD